MEDYGVLREFYEGVRGVLTDFREFLEVFQVFSGAFKRASEEFHVSRRFRIF